MASPRRWRARAELAKRRFAAAGLTVDRAAVGDWEPVIAVEDELRQHPQLYDAIVLSSLPPGLSRWLALDAHNRLTRQLDLPVLHIYRGGDQAMRSKNRAARELIGRPVSAWPSRGRRTPALPGPQWAWGPVPVALLMLLYLSLMVALVLGVNRAFLLNDVIALSVFVLLLAATATMEHDGWSLARLRKHPRR